MVEQQISRRKSRNESPAATLLVFGMNKVLIGHRDPGIGESLTVDVGTGSAHAGDERIRLDRLTEIQDQLRSPPPDAQFGAGHKRRADIQGISQIIEQYPIEIDQPLPA